MIKCAGGCGLTVIDEAQATHQAWSYLSIRATWRCGACERALREAAQIVGPPAEEGFLDLVEPTSRGALPKETASTVKLPEVKP